MLSDPIALQRMDPELPKRASSLLVTAVYGTVTEMQSGFEQQPRAAIGS